MPSMSSQMWQSSIIIIKIRVTTNLKHTQSLGGGSGGIGVAVRRIWHEVSEPDLLFVVLEVIHYKQTHFWECRERQCRTNNFFDTKNFILGWFVSYVKYRILVVIFAHFENRQFLDKIFKIRRNLNVGMEC